MSTPLIPCPACNRHVFTTACTCPFCEARLRACGTSRAGAPTAGLSRAARVAAGAALVGITACGGATPTPLYGAPPPPHDAGGEAGGNAGGDAGRDAGGAGGAGGAAGPLDASPPDAGGDRNVVPIYGAAAPLPSKPVR